MAAALDSWGRLDVPVNNAATGADRICRADEMPVADLDRLYRANARSLLMTPAA